MPSTRDNQGGQGGSDASGDKDFNWQTGQAAPGSAADPAFVMDDFEFGDVTFNRTAEEVAEDAASREFRPIPPGDRELFVAGFFKSPERVFRTGYLDGKEVSWYPYKLGVRLAWVDDPQASVLDFFDLPPDDPREMPAYLDASKGQDGKNPGFGAEKFGFFISRLGYPYPKGSPIPREARKPTNWLNRRIQATIVLQESDPNKLNPTTGEPYPPRSQIKLFSYRPSEATVLGHTPEPPGATTQQPAGRQPAARAGQPTRPAASQGAGRGGQGKPLTEAAAKALGNI
jgi:hypothetical protein